jgi:hypothetical protein
LVLLKELPHRTQGLDAASFLNFSNSFNKSGKKTVMNTEESQTCKGRDDCGQHVEACCVRAMGYSERELRGWNM